MRFDIYCVLCEFKLIYGATFLFHVLARGGGGRHLVVVPTDRSLSRNGALRLHDIGWVHLLSRQHLLGAIAQRRPNGLPAVDARGGHALLGWH